MTSRKHIQGVCREQYDPGLSEEFLGAQFRFLAKPAVAPCHLAGSAPHKTGGHQVKSWPDDIYMDLVYDIATVGAQFYNKPRSNIDRNTNNYNNTHQNTSPDKRELNTIEIGVYTYKPTQPIAFWEINNTVLHPFFYH